MEKVKKIVLTALVLCLLPCVIFAGLKGKVDSGNSLYKKADFEGALSKYQDAQIDEPENPVLHFNSGDARYKMEKYEEAVKEYEKASYSKDIALQAKSYYNIGNSLYKTGKMPEAIQYYQKCLELNPKDKDAKYNIEFVRKKIKEQIDKNKQEGKESKESKDSKEGKKARKIRIKKIKTNRLRKQKRIKTKKTGRTSRRGKKRRIRCLRKMPREY